MSETITESFNRPADPQPTPPPAEKQAAYAARRKAWTDAYYERNAEFLKQVPD